MTNSDTLMTKPSLDIKAPFFIIGAQRSGTTLLRLMLNAHSLIAIPEEGTFWMPLLKKFGTSPLKKIKGNQLHNYLEYIKKNPQFKLWGCDPNKLFSSIKEKKDGCTLGELMLQIYLNYSSQCGKKLQGDKTPSFFRMVPALNRLFPDAKFINLVRDGRDIYLSTRKIEPSRKNISVAALEWSHKVQKVSQSLAPFNSHRHMTIRYEDLVTKPQEIMETICNFLQVEFEPAMLEYWKNSDQFIGSHHSKLIFSPVSSNSVQKWKRQLTKQEIGNYEYLAGNSLRKYGYEMDCGNIKPPQISGRVIWQLLYGLPTRALQIFYTALNLKIASRFGLKTGAAGKGTAPERMGEKKRS